MIHILFIALGGAIGAVLRHLANGAALRMAGPEFPYGTLSVNIIGSFAMGLFIAWLVTHEPQSANLRAFVSVGLLGAFTTFSTFSLDTITLIERGALTQATLYIMASVMIAIVALWAGLVLGKAVL
ncbi:MAG: fluoride efflux transporter CrcB [Micavibrio sp.]|nr:fluoride efflux transporter CrcB [Micavibrio sp.]|tara:strand:+ start:960 stop:1337 length:378 start_codon:yes stop_codon:yes gene_type:complete